MGDNVASSIVRLSNGDIDWKATQSFLIPSSMNFWWMKVHFALIVSDFLSFSSHIVHVSYILRSWQSGLCENEQYTPLPILSFCSHSSANPPCNYMLYMSVKKRKIYAWCYVKCRISIVYFSLLSPLSLGQVSWHFFQQTPFPWKHQLIDFEIIIPFLHALQLPWKHPIRKNIFFSIHATCL